jgi:hypothetical protein
MTEQNTDDIDYENMDDLPLFDHIEWMCQITEKAVSSQQSVADWEMI